MPGLSDRKNPERNEIYLPKKTSSTIDSSDDPDSDDEDGKAVDLKLGENEVKQGNLELTVKHDVYGEQQKTLAVFQDRGHDLR